MMLTHAARPIRRPLEMGDVDRDAADDLDHAYDVHRVQLAQWAEVRDPPGEVALWAAA